MTTSEARPEGVAEEIEAGVLRVSPRRFASLQYTIFVLSGSNSSPECRVGVSQGSTRVDSHYDLGMSPASGMGPLGRSHTVRFFDAQFARSAAEQP